MNPGRETYTILLPLTETAPWLGEETSLVTNVGPIERVSTILHGFPVTANMVPWTV